MRRLALSLILLATAFLAASPPAHAQGQYVSGSITVADAGTCSTASALVLMNLSGGSASVAINVSGTFSATLSFVTTVDTAAHYTAVNAYPPSSTTAVTSTTSTGTWTVSVPGMASLCVYASAYTSGTAVVAMRSTAAISTSTRGGGGGGGGGVSSVSGTANQVTCTGTTTVVCGIANPATTPGPLMVTGALSATGVGIFTGTQMNLFGQFLLNSCNPSTEWNTTQGSYATEALVGCVTMPNTATAPVHGVAGFANSSNTEAAVGVVGSGRALTNNAKGFGANFIAADVGSLTTGVWLIGNNVNIYPANVSSAYGSINGFISSLTAPNAGFFGNGYICNLLSSTGSWSSCFNSADGATTTGYVLGYRNGGSTSIASQVIQADYLDSLGGEHTPSIGVSSTGVLDFAGNPVAISNANFVFNGDSRTYGTGATGQCGNVTFPCTITGPTATTTGTASSGSTTLTVASGTNIANGEQVIGLGIAPSTTVQSGGGTTTLTLTNATTAALSSTAVSFANTDYPSRAMLLAPFAGRGTGYNIGVSGNTCTQVLARYTTDAHTYSPAVTGKAGYLFVNCGTNDTGVDTPTATGTGGVASITVSSATGIDIGSSVTGTGIGVSAKVASTYTGTTTVPLTVVNSGTVSGTVTITPTAASIFAVEASIWNAANADGYTVVAITNPNHVSTSANRIMGDQINELIRGARSSYGYLADIQSVVNDIYNSNEYYSDNVHFTNLGYGLWAQAVANALQVNGGDHYGSLLSPLYYTPGTGNSNIRLNMNALTSLTTGSDDTAAGEGTAIAATTAGSGTFFGYGVATALQTGNGYTCIGNSSCGTPNGGFNGTALGTSANGGATVGNWTCIGANTSCPNNTSVALGEGASTTADHQIMLGTSSEVVVGQEYTTLTNCSSSASPAVCASASAGSVALPTNAVSSSIVVNTTAVTANSQIFITTDDTLGTKLGVTCNSTVATLVGGLTISARTAGTSFTIANNVAVVTNPLCVSYFIVN